MEPPSKVARKDTYYDNSKTSISSLNENKSTMNSKLTATTNQNLNVPPLSQGSSTTDITETKTTDITKVKTEPGFKSDATFNVDETKPAPSSAEIKKEDQDQMSSKDAIVTNSNQANSNSAIENSTPDSKQGPVSNSSVATPKLNQKDIPDNKVSVSGPFSSISQYGSNKSARNVQKKTFKPDELRQALMPVLEKLNIYNPESLPFRQPVDPVFLGIPDYHTIIKRPMDLSTIKRKLDTGQYSDPWQYVDDVWLMFENAWLYNKKNSKVYKYSTRLSEIFETLIDPVMASLGYCCGRKFVFQPQMLLCFGKELCQIPRDAKYMNYKDR